MSANAPLKVVLCWHMHQPQYWDWEGGVYQLPWTYLHAIKDYVDMAAIIEANPAARAVVNFAPILIEQLDDYSRQIKGYLTDNSPLRDPLLTALATSALPSDRGQHASLIKACLRANRERLIDRFIPYRQLVELAECILDSAAGIRYVSQQFLFDLLTWYHLAWMGETVRRKDARIQALMAKGNGYSLHDRRLLLEIIGDQVATVIPRYRKLAESGQVELSVTPYAHPIVPLLLDIKSTHEAMPGAPLPMITDYPGGEARARWHIERGIQVFEEHFGHKPVGCWPSEGSLSEATVELLGEHGFQWAATGEMVLRNSLNKAGINDIGCIHRAYQLKEAPLNCFFRDDGLSDLIGFTYSSWHGDDAVNNLVGHLENIANACHDAEGNRVVSIILDGENAWEYYPENAFHFLTALYKRLGEHPGLELTTFRAVTDAKLPTFRLPNLVAGSWVYGTFSTWIGSGDKNRGWDLLTEAKKVFDRVVATGKLSPERLDQVEQQLAVCEGSDWFWWFGDYNSAESVRDFDRLYRLHLSRLYTLLGVEPPDSLSQIISHGGSVDPANGGVMRRGQE